MVLRNGQITIGNLFWKMSHTFAECQKVGQEDNPGYVIQRNLTLGAKHGASVRQQMYHKANEMLQKARQTKNGGHNTISKNEWTEEQIIQFDELALEDHSYFATREERDRNEKSWVLKLNEEGDQGPMNQRFDFVEAKREMKRLHDEHVKETSEGNTPIHLVQRSRQRRHQQFEGLGESNYQVDAQTGWRGLFFEVTGKFEPVGKVEFLAILIFDRTVGFFLV